MKTTQNDSERNLQSIISMYQQDRRRFFLQKLQLESYIQKELGLSDDWIVELSGNFLKFTGHNIPKPETFAIYDSLGECVVNFSVETDYISKAVEITMELKRMEDDDGE